MKDRRCLAFVCITAIFMFATIRPVHADPIGISPSSLEITLYEYEPTNVSFFISIGPSYEENQLIFVYTDVQWALPELSSFYLSPCSGKYINVSIAPLPAGNYKGLVTAYTVIHDTLIDAVSAYLIVHVLPTANVDVDPDTLNLESNGKWVTAYIELHQPYNASKININSILLNLAGKNFTIDSSAPFAVGDYDGDGVTDLMVKFERYSITSYLGLIDFETDYSGIPLPLTLTGFVEDVPFKGVASIKIIR
jgi:hypothetical protein